MSTANITNEDLLTGYSDLSFRGRISNKEVVNNLSRKIAYQHSYIPASARNLTKFLALREQDSYESVTNSVSAATTITASWQSRLMDEETLTLNEAIQAEAINEAIRNFYNSYMASSNSDIVYRLGQVTRIKHLFTNVRDKYGNVKQTGKDTTTTLGQTDEFGRLDTVSNMRTKVDIEPNITGRNELVTVGYTEYYINWFFPPFTSENFLSNITDGTDALNAISKLATGSASSTAQIQQAKSISQSAVDAALEISNATKNHTNDTYGPTYDYLDMMCARDGFTYRTAAFKAVNDNINFLQYIFEQVSGIVSTYLTEWDISLYIQEGLLSDYQTTKNVWLCNRLQMDNPQGLTNDGAYTWGALNACISKLSVDGNGPSNTKTWIPSYYYASAYWMPYTYGDRGDGLDVFWDYAINSGGKYTERNDKLSTTTAGRIQHDDEIHAAFAGWHNFNDIQYYQILYTTPDDGLSTVDTVHLQETTDGFSSLQEELMSIQDAVYADDDSLGYPDSSLTETIGMDGGPIRYFVSNVNTANPYKAYDKKVISYQMSDPYDSNSKVITSVLFYLKGQFVASTDGDGNDTSSIATSSGSDGTNTVSISGEGDISVMGCPIPGSSLLKLFLKKDSYKSKAMSIADKTGSNSSGGFWNPTNNRSSSENSSDPNSAQSLGSIGEQFNTSPYESEHYSNNMGIPRLGPVLYGGPHGAATSPQCVQSYFQADNPFLRPIARIEPSITDWTVDDKAHYYTGVEEQYKYTQGVTKPGIQLGAQIGRSPSESLHILRSGYCETVPDYIMVFKTIYGYIEPTIQKFYGHRWGWHRFDYDWYKTSYYTSTTNHCSYSDSYYEGKCRFHRMYLRYHYPTYLGRNYSNTGPCMVNYSNKYKSGRRWVNIATYRWGTRYWANDWYIGKTINWYGQKCRVVKTYTYSNGLHSTDNVWNFLYSVNNIVGQYWYNQYTLQAYIYAPLRYGSYTNFVREIYQRPLMHNMPDLKWQIAKYRFMNHDPQRKGSIDGFYEMLRSKWGISSNYHYASQFFNINVSGSSQMYRLTTPTTNHRYRVNVVWYDKVTNSEHCPPSHYTYIDRYQGEQDIIDKILVNATNPYAWHYPFYCIMNDYNGSEVTNRRVRGPRYLAQIPTRLRYVHLTYTGITHHNDRHKCHKDCHYRNVTRETQYSWIEVDLEHTKQFWASSNYVDKVFEASSTAPDIMSDWPDQSSWLKDNTTSIFDIMKDWTTMTPFGFAGEDFGEEQNHGIRGIGIYAALPGLLKEIPNQEYFEDGNNYLNLGRMMGTYAAQNTKIKNLPLTTTEITNFGTRGQVYTDYQNGRFYIPGGKRIYSRFIMGPYKPGLRWKYRASGFNRDPGMDKFLKNMYLTATLFIPDRKGTIDQNLHPFITNVSSCLRTALKMVKHQRAYIVYAKELFENVIDPNEVINLLDKSVDKRVTSASCSNWPLKSESINPYYDQNNIYYNYWIDKAYTYYKGLSGATGNNNALTPMQSLSAAFQKRINQIDSFTNDALNFINNKNGGYSKLSSDEWSYNDFLTVYKIFGNFRSTLDNPDNTVEEYFYSYLNVLYEYRKYYINKRCNKQDGTLWACRQFESIIPALSTAKTTSPDPDSPLISTSEPGMNQYNIVMKAVQNTLKDKALAIANNKTLDTDRICRLYMTVDYTTETKYNEFLTALSSGTSSSDVDEILKARKWDKVNGTYQTVYIKKPRDGTYRLISREYIKNKQNIDYNEKLDDLYQRGIIDLETKKSREKIVNEDILDCIFPIIWNQDTSNEILQAYLKAAQELRTTESNLTTARTNYQNIQITYKDLIAENQKSETEVDTDYLEKKNLYEMYLKELEDANDFAPIFFSITGWNIRTCENISRVEYLNNYTLLKKYVNKQISFSNLPSNIQILLKSSESESIQDGKVYLQKLDDYYTAGNALQTAKTSMNDSLQTKYAKYAYNIRREVYYNGLSNSDTAILNQDDGVLSLLSKKLDTSTTDIIKTAIFTYSSTTKAYTNKTIKGQIAILKNTYDNAVTAYNDASEAYETANKSYMKSLSKLSKEQYDAKYTWRDSGANNNVYPTIAWNVPTGIDISAINSGNSNDTETDAINKLCGLKKYNDYWVITIPESSWPYDIGYDTNLRIKTYEADDAKDANTYTANRLTTIAGPFAYALYPITEDQNDSIAAMGANLSGLSDKIRETFQ